jgi:UDP-N-acetylglucosamine--N-acetylmuramyl-(pentapeptide) pyrophosphoryl-undecaprenol N-acetylglucosamine transferase
MSPARWSTPRLGSASRLAAPFAERVFLSFPVEGKGRPKYKVTGRPIPARSKPVPRAEARELFGLPAQGPVLVVFGGSQGSRSLNELTIEAFGESGPGVLHLAGERDYEGLRARVKRPDYVLLPYTEDFGAAISAAELVLSRAGGSVWVMAAAGKPAILVPYPFATADHQAKNAAFFEQAGGVIVMPETELGRVPELARPLLDDPDRLTEMGEAMLLLARPNAAAEIAEELIGLV